VTVTPAQQARADRMAMEQDHLVAAGVSSSRSIVAKIRADVIRAWRAGGDVSAPIIAARRKFADVVTTGMVASHLQGTLRAAIAVRRARGVQLAAVDDFAAKLAKQLDWSGRSLADLSARYFDSANIAARDATDAAAQLVLDSTRKLTADGIPTNRGVDEIRKALDRAGLGVESPRLIETVYRTEFQSTYQAARWQANEAPEIQEILWGYEYVTVGDDRVRPSHAALEGVRLPKDDPRWETIYPPNGYNCRCQVIEIFKNERIARTIEPPAPKEVDGVLVVPGPDEGFGVNVGLIRR